MSPYRSQCVIEGSQGGNLEQNRGDAVHFCAPGLLRLLGTSYPGVVPPTWIKKVPHRLACRPIKRRSHLAYVKLQQTLTSTFIIPGTKHSIID